MANLIAPNPFTPKSGMEPRVFGGREREIEFFQKKLEEAKRGKCDHFLVLGDWGIGKTTLLKKFKEIAQGQKMLTSLITVSEFDESSTILDGTKLLMEQIPLKLPIDTSKLKNFVKQIDSLGIQIMGFGLNFSKPITGFQPQTLLLNTLLTLWQDLKNESKIVVVLLDDVQNFSNIPGIFTNLKNILSDEKIVGTTRFLFGLSSTTEAWKNFLQRNHPIGRYFTPRLHLDKLPREETIEVLDKSLLNTNVVFENEIKELVFKYTNGHLYELQVLCSNLYENQVGGRVSKKIWKIPLATTLKELGETVFDALYKDASPQERKVLYIASHFEEPFEQKKILSHHLIRRLKLSESTIKTSLSRLFDKGLLTRPYKFKHFIPDKLFATYVLDIKGYDGSGKTI